MQARDIFLAFRNERDQVSLNEIMAMVTQADPRTQSNCQLLIAKLRRNIGGQDVRVNQRQLIEILDMNPKIKANFDLIFDTISQGDTVTLQQLRMVNSRYNLGLSPQQMELMMKSASRRTDGSVSRAELYEFLRDF